MRVRVPNLQLEVERVRDALRIPLAQPALLHAAVLAQLGYFGTQLCICVHRRSRRVGGGCSWSGRRRPPPSPPHREQRMPTPPRRGPGRTSRAWRAAQPWRKSGHTSRRRPPMTLAWSAAPPVREACWSRCVRRWTSASLPVGDQIRRSSRQTARAGTLSRSAAWAGRRRRRRVQPPPAAEASRWGHAMARRLR